MVIAVNFPIFLRVIFLRPFEEDFKYFKLKGSDSPFQLLLKLYRHMFPPVLSMCFLIFAVKFIEIIEGFRDRWYSYFFQEYFRRNREGESSRWNQIFAKLQRISKAIKPKEEAVGIKAIGVKSIGIKEANDAPKPKAEKKVSRMSSLSKSLFHSSLFNRKEVLA